eukprot:m.3709 g.3709  ORF g.3709 m.3709 type:complete len:393 (+) comp9723_c0_seq1:184-1362(+)
MSTGLFSFHRVQCTRSVASLLHQFDPLIPAEKAYTAPQSWYVSQAFYDIECLSVFRNNWIPLACASVELPGQFETGRIGKEHYIVSRDKNNRLHAFSNVCRHRGAIVENRNQGLADCFRCPYHSWEYGLDGKLLKAVDLKGISGFSAKKSRLPSFEVKEWGPVTMGRLDGSKSTKNGDEFHKFLTMLKDHDKVMGSDEYIHVCRKDYVMECNWKVFVDNFLDGGYHLPSVHEPYSKELDVASAVTIADENGGYTATLFEALGSNQLRVSMDSSAPNMYCYFYPNLLVHFYGIWFETNRIIPLGARKCKVVFDYWIEREASKKVEDLDDFVNSCVTASDQIQLEDVAVCESVQLGMEAPSYSRGRYVPKWEHADHTFHSRLYRDVTGYIESEL